MKTLTCPCCDSLMREINKSSKHLYFRCGNCGFYTARNFDNSSPYADYSDYKVGDDSFTKDWSARVQEAMRIVSKKFSITNLKSGNFLDIGCSEGFYVEAAQKLGWNAFGVEVAGPSEPPRESRRLVGLNDHAAKRDWLADNWRKFASASAGGI